MYRFQKQDVRPCRLWWAVIGALLATGCADAADDQSADGHRVWRTFETPPLTVEAGTERYACVSITQVEGMTIDRFEFDGAAVVHHYLLSKALAPEPEGVAECDVLFRTTWLPLMAGGTGPGQVDAPAGAGYQVSAGDQLILQLHLLNPGVSDVEDTIGIRMRLTDAVEVEPVGLFAFGTTALSLAPNALGSSSHTCVIDETSDIKIFAALPHMHTLGTRLVFEHGPSEDALVERFRVDPWDFDQQVIEPLDLTLKPGDVTRVTCEFDNTTDATVTFGESTFDEMCFFVTFATGAPDLLDGCLELTTQVDPGGDAFPERTGPCGSEPANASGIGAACTAGGAECLGGTTCTADQPGGDGTGFCMTIGSCGSHADCGGGSAVCCSPAQGGGLIQICLPNNCRPDDCRAVTPPEES